jgi:hypothetical protein
MGYSPEEYRERKIQAMGPQPGQLHFELGNSLALLHLKWAQFTALFAAGQPVLDLLDRTARHFFLVVRIVLIDDIILHLCRLSDPPKSGRKENLTVLHLSPLLPDPALAARVRELCERARAALEPAREYRNRQVAHTDVLTLRAEHPDPLPAVTRESIEGALELLRDVLNSVESHYLNSTTAYEHGFAPRDAERLLDLLRLAEEADVADQDPDGGGSRPATGV